MVNAKEENVSKATVIVMITLFLSRVLGLVREMLMTNFFGASMKSDAYIAAFTLPDIMSDLLVAGALSAGFIPVFIEFLAKDDEDGAWKAANTFITVALLFILGFNIIGEIFTKYLVPFVAAGVVSNPEKYMLTVSLTRVILPAVTFTVMAGIVRGVLNSYKIFKIPAFGPVVYNMGIILGTIILSKPLGIYGIAIGAVFGAIANFSIQIPKFSKVSRRFKFELDFRNSGYKRMLQLLGPTIIGLAIVRAQLLVNQNIASFLDNGSLSAMRYAQRIMLLPVGIFSAAISTTIYPTMSSQIARKEYEDFKKTFSLGLRVLIFITIPAAVGMIVLNVPIVRLLFKQGKFTEGNVSITAIALAFYSFASIGMSIVPIIIRGFYSVQDTKTPVKISTLILVVNAVLSLFIVNLTNLGIGGIAFSTSITSILEMTLLYKLLGKKLNHLRTKELIVSVEKSVISSLVMGSIVFITYRIIEELLGHNGKPTQIIVVGLPVIIGIIIYAVAAYILKMDEFNYVLDLVKKRFKRA